MSIEHYLSKNSWCNSNHTANLSEKTTLNSKNSAELIICLANMLQAYLKTQMMLEVLNND